MKLTTTSLTLTTVYDNYASTKGVQTRHGFACLIEADGNRILFDTGGDGSVLMSNLHRLGISLKDLDAVVLSHIHGDHTGGVGSVLAANAQVEVIMPASFPERFKKAVAARGARVREIERPETLAPGIATTGEMGAGIVEQSLLVSTPKGLVIVTGCAHPGIVETVRRARQLTGMRIHLVLGGFHLAGVPTAELRRILSELKELNVERVAPCHCTGDPFRHLAEEVYQENYIPNGIGTVLSID
jgi:7,8-dihydropterin-6-yl-methyl-4-(beta-D-ribofuranosyl)aminobenzene 5'-phosphate synthase